jgi:hypothetical protein
MCLVESEKCTKNADCCSNICDPAKGQCKIDEANKTCRPTGEDCSSGTGSGCCEVCNKQTNRCDFGPSVCKPQGVACTTDANCCKGKCQQNAQGKTVCNTPCVANAGACAQNADCCGFACNAGTCGPPVTGTGGAPGDASTCTFTGSACTTSAQCCSGTCIGGLCDLLCQVAGGACTASGDCCSGICLGGLCKPPIK